MTHADPTKKCRKHKFFVAYNITKVDGKDVTKAEWLCSKCGYEDNGVKA